MDITIKDIQYPFDDHDGFHIYLKSGEGLYQLVNSIPKSESSTVLTGLNENVRQCVQLVAYNSLGIGPMSDELCIGSPPHTMPPLGKPTFQIIVIE